MPSSGQLLAQLNNQKNQGKVHIYAESEGRTSNLLITRLGDLEPPVTDSADKHDMLLLSERDSSHLFSLLQAIEMWSRSREPRDIYNSIVDSFANPNVVGSNSSGPLSFFGLSFCRLWLYVPEVDIFRSAAEIGLTANNHKTAFASGSIILKREENWLFHALRLVRPAIYQEVDRTFPDNAQAVEAVHPQSFPYYEVARRRWPAELELSGLHSWIEAPLIVGDATIGILSCSVPEDLNSGTWFLLNIACQAAGAILRTAQLQEEKNLWLDRVQHNLSADVHGIIGYISTALYKLTKEERSEDTLDDAILALTSALKAEENIRRQRAKFHFGISGFRNLHRTEDDLVQRLREDLESVRGGLNDVELIVNLEVESASVHTDHAELCEVVRELIGNARAGPTGTDGASRIEIRVEQSRENTLRISVTDNGPGVPPIIESRLFERKNEGSLKSTGTGIGLNKCFVTVKELGGRMTYESSGIGNAGATFVIELPLTETSRQI